MFWVLDFCNETHFNFISLSSFLLYQWKWDGEARTVQSRRRAPETRSESARATECPLNHPRVRINIERYTNRVIFFLLFPILRIFACLGNPILLRTKFSCSPIIEIANDNCASKRRNVRVQVIPSLKGKKKVSKKEKERRRFREERERNRNNDSFPSVLLLLHSFLLLFLSYLLFCFFCPITHLPGSRSRWPRWRRALRRLVHPSWLPRHQLQQPPSYWTD